jgi:hypothetical protein
MGRAQGSYANTGIRDPRAFPDAAIELLSPGDTIWQRNMIGTPENGMPMTS